MNATRMHLLEDYTRLYDICYLHRFLRVSFRFILYL